MRKLMLLTAMLSSGFLSISYTGIASSTQTTNITFTGELTEGSCNIATESMNQIISLNQNPTHIFDQTGKKSTAVPFNITLLNCSHAIKNTLLVKFTGNYSSTKPELLETTGTAEGVGVRITHNGNNLTQGQTPKIAIQNGQMTIPFEAAYETIDPALIQAGTTSTTATINITYQ